MNKFLLAVAAAGVAVATQAGAITLTQTQSQTSTGQNFTFNFAPAPAADAGGTLTIRARGDYSPGVSVESFNLSIDGGLFTANGIGTDNSTVINAYSFDDQEFEHVFALSAATLSSILADNAISLLVDLDGNVNSFAPTAFITATFDYEVADVPEPAMLGLFGLGALGLGLSRRRRA